MTIWWPRIAAIVLLLVGIVWVGQGLGFIQGSVMTGSAFWAVMGVLCLLGSAALAYRSLRGAGGPRS